jgi:small-conductance mechanosensitive channel
MVAGSGVLAIVLGLALQNTLSDFFAGVALNIERPFKAGEWITLDDKTDGLVLSTTWRSTHIRTRSLDVVIVPNSLIAKSRFTNRAHPTPLNISAITIRMAYGFDFDRLKTCAEATALTIEGIKKSPTPLVLLDTFNDWTVSIRLYFCPEDFGNLLLVQGHLSNAVYSAIRADDELRRFMPQTIPVFSSRSENA